MNWLTEFAPFTPFHAVVLIACIIPTWAICWMGSRATQANPDGDKTIRVWLAWSIIIWQTAINAWWFFLSDESINLVLPLHVCDIAAIAAGPALLWKPRFAISLVYFWGLALSSQAFITPVLEKGLAAPQFWSFWVGHTQIVGCAIYFIVTGYRPKLRDFIQICIASAIYGIAVAIVNLSLTTNYGYMGPSKPDAPTILDKLGPFPQRAFLVAAIGYAAVFAAYIPWPISRALAARKAQASTL